jgi:uncharacterized protein (TIGR02147 family)
MIRKSSESKDIAEIFKEEFDWRRKKNGRYSQRAFARDLKISQTTLSCLLGGSRTPGTTVIRRGLISLGWAQAEIEEKLSELSGKSQFVYLNAEEYQQLCEHWCYFAILSLAELKSFRPTPNWIAHHLNISVKLSKRALLFLKKKRFLIESVDGALVLSGYKFSIGNHKAIRAAHKSMLTRSFDVLRQLNRGEQRDNSDFSAIIVATSSESLEKAKKDIREFRKKLERRLDSAKGKDLVIGVGIQLFPLSLKTSEK